MVEIFGIINKKSGEILGSESSPFDVEGARNRAQTSADKINEKFGVECEVKVLINKWKCDVCSTKFDLPKERCCPTCKTIEIIPVLVVKE
ncbi:hypothetical protein [Paenibacillus agricola]|uniref:Uncharacterized protein n=1 Tax=Paenibacillus agricola TaxID=2716264 RepID=A0ABX0JA47_9BACL|nr:hypothetical protein [Paenibacillus agricola]NHN33320.1 hypothetical protein [Paenibacillus agricola]